MMIPARASRPSGFSLIEVLIAVVILSFGLLALSALQGSLFRNSAESKAQSVGLSLASEKLEYFRGYRDSTVYTALTSGADGTAGAPLAVGGVDYTRSWTVTRYAYPEAGGNFTSVGNTAALGATYASNNEFKRVSVTVGWTDPQGNPQSVTLEDAIAAIDPGDSRKIAKNAGSARPRGPEVRIYTPTSQQEGVIPIAIGDGTDTAATNPKPLINAGNVIETRFDILTYSGVSGNTASSQSRIQTSVVACTCDTAEADATEYGKRPTYWNGVGYVEPEDATFTIPAGEAASATTQSDLCTMCCRDHHDPASIGATQARFDPRNSDHASAHSLLNPSTGALTASVGPYTEACRVIRVGGFFRVAADIYDDYMNVLDTNSLVASPDVGKSVYVPTAAATLNYQNFVKGYLSQRVVSAAESAYNTVLATNIGTTSGLESTHSLNAVADSISVQAPKTFGASDLPKWLHARGLYVDYLEPAAVQAVKDAKTGCQGTGTLPPTTAQIRDCVLKVLPFTSINLTELARWTPGTEGTEIVVATNNFGGTLTSTEPVKGKVTRGNSPTNNLTTNAAATARRSNSGLTTLKGGIDADDALTTAPQTWTAIQPFTIQGGAPSGGKFTVQLLVAGSAYPYSENTQKTPYINSTLAGVTCNAPGATGAHPCNSTNPLGGTQTLTFGNYNYEKVGTSNAPITCSNGVGGTKAWSGTSYSTKICRDYAVTGVTGGGTATILAAASPGVKAETTAVQLSGVVDNAQIVVTFGAPTDTLQPTTCAWSTKKVKGQTVDVFVVTSPNCP